MMRSTLLAMVGFAVSACTTNVAPSSTISGTTDVTAPRPARSLGRQTTRAYDFMGAPQIDVPTVESFSMAWQQGDGTTADDLPFGIAYDASGNAYVTGIFEVSINFGCGPMTPTGSSGVFLVKFNSSGLCSWSQTLSGDGDAGAMSVAVAGDGSVIVGGFFSGALPGGLASNGGYDGLIARWTSDGVFSWARAIGGANDEYVNAVRANGSNVVVGGSYGDGTDFGGGSRATAGDADAFVAQYKLADGSYVSDFGFGGTDYDAVNAVDIDASNNAWVVASFSGAITIGGQPLTSAGGYDGLLAHVTPAGAVLGVTTFGGTSDDGAAAVAVDASGGVRVVGYFQSSATVGSSTLTGTGNYSGMIASFDSNMALQWAHVMDASDEAIAESVALDSAGGAYVTGRMGGTGAADLGGLASKGTKDMLLVKYGADGSLVSAQNMGDSGTSDGIAVGAVAYGSLNHVIVAGAFDTTTNCGGGVLTSAGANDVALCAYTIP